MSEHILEYLELSSAIISLFAVVVIVAGFALAAVRYARHWSDMTREGNFHRFKIDLAHPLTLGLEILVVADVIETIVVKPTFQSLAVLGFLVVVRTAVSWTLALQIEGHWPWQVPAEEQTNA